jgi:hypothetical protein
MHYLDGLLTEVAQYRVLRDIYRRDPSLGAATVAKMRECFRTDRDDVRALRRRRSR